MKYYNAKQIAELTGYALSMARHKIQSLNEELKEKYPNKSSNSSRVWKT